MVFYFFFSISLFCFSSPCQNKDCVLGSGGVVPKGCCYGYRPLLQCFFFWGGGGGARPLVVSLSVCRGGGEWRESAVREGGEGGGVGDKSRVLGAW